jgi:hypothetical protein
VLLHLREASQQPGFSGDARHSHRFGKASNERAEWHS